MKENMHVWLNAHAGIPKEILKGLCSGLIYILEN